MTYQTITPYRNRERKVDHVWDLKRVESETPAPAPQAKVVSLTARKVGEANYQTRRFGHSNLKRVA